MEKEYMNTAIFHKPTSYMALHGSANNIPPREYLSRPWLILKEDWYYFLLHFLLLIAIILLLGMTTDTADRFKEGKINTLRSIPLIYEEKLNITFTDLGSCPDKPTEQYAVSWNDNKYYTHIETLGVTWSLKWPLLFSMTIITIIAHGLRFGFGILEPKYILDKYRDRWIEYALSSPLMIVLVAASANIVDFGQMLLLAVTQSIMQGAGYIIEQSTRTHDMALKVLGMMMGWTLFISQWYLIFEQLYTNIGTFECFNDQKMPTQAPIIIVWTQFFFFLSFGLVSLYTAFSHNLERANTLYTFLSFSSKFTLTFLLIWEAATVRLEVQD